MDEKVYQMMLQAAADTAIIEAIKRVLHQPEYDCTKVKAICAIIGTDNVPYKSDEPST